MQETSESVHLNAPSALNAQKAILIISVPIAVANKCEGQFGQPTTWKKALHQRNDLLKITVFASQS